MVEAESETNCNKLIMYPSNIAMHYMIIFIASLGNFSLVSFSRPFDFEEKLTFSIWISAIIGNAFGIWLSHYIKRKFSFSDLISVGKHTTKQENDRGCLIAGATVLAFAILAFSIPKISNLLSIDYVVPTMWTIATLSHLMVHRNNIKLLEKLSSDELATLKLEKSVIVGFEIK